MNRGSSAWNPEMVHLRMPSNGKVGPTFFTTTCSALPYPTLRYGVVVIVPASQVRWIGSAGNYAELHVAGGSHLVRATLAELEAGLDPERFVRIHRGALVRLDCVREVIPATHGDYDVVLDDNVTLKLSRRFRGRLLP